MKQTDNEKGRNPEPDGFYDSDSPGCAMMLAAGVILAALLLMGLFRLITLIF